MIDLNIIYSIITLQRPFLKLKTPGSFFRTKDIKKICDIDLSQVSKIENLKPYLLDIIDNLINKKKIYNNLYIQNIELDSIIDNRIQSILNELNNLYFNLHYILELNNINYPSVLKLNIDDSLPDLIKNKILKLINNYNNNYTSINNLINLKNLIKLHSYLKKKQKIIVNFDDFYKIINNSLILNDNKININDYIINKFTINILYDNIPISNIIYYKKSEFSKLEFIFKFSYVYNKIFNNIYYYNIIKVIRSFIKVSLINNEFPKYLYPIAKNIKEKMDSLSDVLGKYSYKICKYDLLYKNNKKYYKKYKKYYKKINKYSIKYLSQNIYNNYNFYKYILDNMIIKF